MVRPAAPPLGHHAKKGPTLVRDVPESKPGDRRYRPGTYRAHTLQPENETSGRRFKPIGRFSLPAGETHKTRHETLQLGQSQGQSQGQTRAWYQQVVPALNGFLPKAKPEAMNGFSPSLEWPQNNAAHAPGRHLRLVPAHPALMNGFGVDHSGVPAQ